MLTIRAMRPDDADAVRLLDALAFTPYMQQRGARAGQPRTRENILANLALNPEGCFVAEDEGLEGYVFSRRWGRIGWIGTFGVEPRRHGQGIGRQLLSRAFAGLDAAGCRAIGLETMPDSAYNVGFYARAGFEPANVTLTFEGHIAAPAPPAAPLSDLVPNVGLAAVSAVSRAAMPGLDLAPEARNALTYGWGETLLVGWPEAWATVTLRTVPKREGAPASILEVDALAIRPEAAKRLHEALGAATAYGAARGLGTLRVPANAADRRAIREMLDLGLVVSHVALRMLRRGHYRCPRGVELSRWAM
ncbi:MAG: N-acetyltransferase [Anaerolineae bacterium]|nr:N-acetyltransferase [Anaerolineae bacterium]